MIHWTAVRPGSLLPDATYLVCNMATIHFTGVDVLRYYGGRWETLTGRLLRNVQATHVCPINDPEGNPL